MAKHNRICALFLAAAWALVMFIGLCPCAHALAPDLQRKCSVIFTMNYNGSPLSGGSLRMYRIATWTVENGSYEFTWVPELADAGMNLSEKGNETFARHVSMLIESRSLPAIVRPIDANGKATFTDLECGLYVVYQLQPTPGYEPINAYCISLPMLVDGELVYDLKAVPKPRPEEDTTKIQDVTTPNESTTGVTTPGETTPEDEPTTAVRTTDGSSSSTTTVPSSDRPEDVLPQTGQLWWPTWLLGSLGTALLGLGITLRVLFRHTSEESEI